MNHVPDAVLTAIDEFGEQLLRGTAQGKREQLRTDLWIALIPEDESTAICRYETVHTQSPTILRDRGSFISTIVDGVEARLEQWGIDPPEVYRYVDTIDGTHHYEGTLRLP